MATASLRGADSYFGALSVVRAIEPASFHRFFRTALQVPKTVLVCIASSFRSPLYVLDYYFSMEQTLTMPHIQTFADLQLIAPLCDALAAENYETPTPIQAAAIPPLLKGRDLMGCAQTGTGKTAAFALPILQRLDEARRAAVRNCPRVLVLSPTRELAAQISESFSAYGRFVRFRQTVISGGVSQVPQVRALSRGVHVLVATPGRLLDLMEQKHVSLNQVEVFVLDEADRMLDMGFLPDLKKIIARLPKQRQSLFFSATMPDDILELSRSLLKNPIHVSVTPPSSLAERVEHSVMFVNSNEKTALLCRVLDEQVQERALIFTRTKHGADRLAKQLIRAGYQAAAIHGNKSQAARKRTLGEFRSGALRLLVATDLAARGIDIDGISHVINFDLPNEPTSYVHRIGRTARAGAAGTAISFCASADRGMLRAIERHLGDPIPVADGHEERRPYPTVSKDSKPSPSNRHKRYSRHRRAL